MNIMRLLHHPILLVVIGRDIEKSLNPKRHISRVMKEILVGDFRVSQLLIESFVLVGGDLTLISVPDGLQIVEHLPIELNRVADELRELFDNLFDFTIGGELSAVSTQLQGNLGTSFKT